MAVARQFLTGTYPENLVRWGGSYYTWTGQGWALKEKERLRTELYRMLEFAKYVDKKDEGRLWAPNARSVELVLQALGAIVSLGEGLSPPCWRTSEQRPAHEFLPMKNGLFYIPERKLHTHTRNFFGLHTLPFPYDRDAAPPARWLAFLRELWADDPASIRTLQEVFGYLLSGRTDQQKIIALIGPRRSGKGTILRVLAALLGKESVVAPTLSSLATPFGLQPLIGRSAALLCDARFNVRDIHVVVERLLSISGEDPISVDRKYMSCWTGRLPVRFVIATNEVPKLADPAGALASRLLPLVLVKSFLGREDLRLSGQLLSELPRIFNWALEGLDRLDQNNRLQAPPSGRAAAELAEDLSSPIRTFIRECCEVGPDYSVSTQTIWNAWKRWCSSMSLPRGSIATLGRDLAATVPTLRKERRRLGTKRENTYIGFGLLGAARDYGRENQAATSEFNGGNPQDRSESGDWRNPHWRPTSRTRSGPRSETACTSFPSREEAQQMPAVSDRISRLNHNGYGHPDEPSGYHSHDYAFES